MTSSRRGFLKAGGMLSVSSLMGTAALMTYSDDAQAATEWAERFQANDRLMELPGYTRGSSWRTDVNPSLLTQQP